MFVLLINYFVFYVIFFHILFMIIMFLEILLFIILNETVKNCRKWLVIKEKERVFLGNC